MPMMFFYFLKIIFDISTSKRSKKYKPHSILKKKNSNLDETQVQTQYQTFPTTHVNIRENIHTSWFTRKDESTRLFPRNCGCFSPANIMKEKKNEA
jgi:hypothetical protein